MRTHSPDSHLSETIGERKGEKKLPEKIQPSHHFGINAWNHKSLSSGKHLKGCLWGLIKSSTVIIIITAGDWGRVVVVWGGDNNDPVTVNSH